MKDEFVFIATHDLRTPVTAITGYIYIIKEDKKKLPENTQKNLAAVEESAARLEKLVDDLLQVAQSESGTIQIKVSPVDINKLIRVSIVEITPLAKEKNVTIETALEKESMILADKDRLVEVMENLLSNAIKFNREGGNIKVFTKKVNDKLHISISDTGYGIPKDKQNKVFQKFFRIRTKETAGIAGTGLGLFVVRMLIEKMKGKISFTSEEGKGTTFTFILPLSKNV